MLPEAVVPAAVGSKATVTWQLAAGCKVPQLLVAAKPAALAEDASTRTPTGILFAFVTVTV
jgi:hypothetical protein